jgi:hypothetical protein
MATAISATASIYDFTATATFMTARHDASHDGDGDGSFTARRATADL